MQKIWIVVANGSHSTILKAKNVNTLIHHLTLDHEESHLFGKDLTADKQGRQTRSQGFGTDTYQPKTTTKVKESTHFATTIANLIEEALQAGEIEKLYIIAKAPFLGHLKQALSANATKLIAAEIHKDLNHLTPEKVRDYLPPVL